MACHSWLSRRVSRAAFADKTFHINLTSWVWVSSAVGSVKHVFIPQFPARWLVQQHSFASATGHWMHRCRVIWGINLKAKCSCGCDCGWWACLYIGSIWKGWLVCVFAAVDVGSQTNVFVSTVPLCRLCVSLQTWSFTSNPSAAQPLSAGVSTSSLTSPPLFHAPLRKIRRPQLWNLPPAQFRGP